MRQETVVGVEDVPGHAIDAAEVAAVGDRDPQVVHAPAAGVRDRSCGVAGCQRRVAHERIQRRPPCARIGGADIGERDDRGHAA